MPIVTYETTGDARKMFGPQLTVALGDDPERVPDPAVWLASDLTVKGGLTVVPRPQQFDCDGCGKTGTDDEIGACEAYGDAVCVECHRDRIERGLDCADWCL